jgi:hypothetical protein
MLDIKRHELFGPKVSLRAFSFGEARHAKFVIRDKKELVISFGKIYTLEILDRAGKLIYPRRSIMEH